MSYNPLPQPADVVVNTGIGTSAVSSSNPLPVSLSSANPLPVSLPAMSGDAFGRLRVSNPLTLFDSSHRFRDNNLWSTGLTGVGATSSFSVNEGLMNLGVGTVSGEEVIRETTKVFAYQPGKSLLILNTFAMNPAKTNLRQRVGYGGTANGIYLELDGTTLNVVERTFVTGSVTETRVPQSSWNIDTVGAGALNPSGVTLDISKAQIIFTDIEWLGLGTVRVGFVIDGQFIHCHSFHHANLITSTYITTASLPLRYEITNTGITTSSSTLKQVCSTVISEGGYELRGLQQAIGTLITAPKTLTTAGTYYPIVSLRLKSSPDRLDAIVIMTALSSMGEADSDYNWQVIASGTTGGGSWVSAGIDSAVEYKLDGTSITGGRILASGFMNTSKNNSGSIDILKEALFKFQLERDSLNGVAYELSLCAAAAGNGKEIFGSVDWEEISR